MLNIPNFIFLTGLKTLLLYLIGCIAENGNSSTPKFVKIIKHNISKVCKIITIKPQVFEITACKGGTETFCPSVSGYIISNTCDKPNILSGC